MKTFVTSSLLAVLSAVVFGWFMVRMGGELPRRSLDSYPPMIVEPAVEPETAPIEVAPAEADPEVVEGEKEDESKGIAETEPKPVKSPAKKRPIEAYGPPAPVLPFVLNVNGAEEGVSLQGSIPTKKTKVAIEKAIAGVFEEGPLENRLKFSPETRSGLWISYLPEFLERYFAYTGGNHEVTIVDEKLILRGAVATEEAKAAVLSWIKPFRKYGLELDEQVEVDESLKGKLTEIPSKLAAAKPSKPQKPKTKPVDLTEAVAEETELVAEVEVVEAVVEAAPESAEVPIEVVEAAPEPAAEEVAPEAQTETPEAGTELVFMGPFDEFYEVHTVPQLAKTVEEGVEVEEEEKETIHVSASGNVESDEDPEPAVAEARTIETPVADDGKPLIFYFDTGSAEIEASDREKIQRAIQRASRPRSIVYITGYSDYRGSFKLNQQLALARANRVKDLIFAGDIADQVTAEVKSKGDSQSKYSTNDSDAALQHSRRVVVEVYHLK